MITSALSGLLDGVEYIHDDLFNLDIPKLCPGVPSNILNPRNTWANGEEYDKQALKLAKMFEDNFKAKYPNMNKEIAQAGPNSKVVSL